MITKKMVSHPFSGTECLVLVKYNDLNDLLNILGCQ